MIFKLELTEGQFKRLKREMNDTGFEEDTDEDYIKSAIMSFTSYDEIDEITCYREV
jgi:hypothetical protein